nr:histidine--tRNA ligase [Pseudoclavibacter chungangensis]
MRDFLPADKRRRERVLAVIRETFRAHGFDEIETPVMEESDRLHSGLGGDNEKMSFGVLKRRISREELEAAAAADDAAALSDLGLRFDLTVPLARFYATHRGSLPTVFRSIQVAPVWRGERPQKGRYRQFVQCDIDVLGEPGELAEIELLTAGSATLQALGLGACTIRINDRRLLGALLAGCGFADDEQAAALISIDKLDKIGAEGVVDELHERDADAAARLGEVLAGWEPRIAAGIAPTREGILDALPPALREAPGVDDAATALDRISTAVAASGGVPIVFDPTLVRGMGYYTGTIFEVAHPESGSSVGGGGRYDGMIGRFLGQDVPACGFSLGFERIIDLAVLDDDASVAREVALLVDRRLPAADAVAVKRAVLASGDAARVRVERKPKNVRALITQLEQQGFTHVAHLRDEHVADPASLRFEAIGEEADA